MLVFRQRFHFHWRLGIRLDKQERIDGVVQLGHKPPSARYALQVLRTLGALGCGEAGDECQHDDGKTFLHRVIRIYYDTMIPYTVR